jgi:hypothetical protein
MADALSAHFPVDSVVPNDRLHDWLRRYGATLATEPLEVLRRAPNGYTVGASTLSRPVVLEPDISWGDPYFVTSVAGCQPASLFHWYANVAFTYVQEAKRARGLHCQRARWTL